MGGGEGVDGVLGDDVQAVGGVGEHADAAGLDRQRFGADREVDRGGAELGEPADLCTPASVSYQPPSETMYTARGRRRFSISRWPAPIAIASPAKAVPPPTRIAGTLAIDSVLSLSRAAALPRRTVATLPPTARNAEVTIHTIGPSAYSCAPIEPEVSTTSRACGSSSGAVISRVIVHG